MKNGNDASATTLMSACKTALKAVERKNDKLATLQGEYMAACKAEREDIKDIYATAKDRGVQTRALKMLVKHRAIRHRMDRDIVGLEEDIRAAFQNYDHAANKWDTTPLGAASKGPSVVAMAS